MLTEKMNRKSEWEWSMKSLSEASVLTGLFFQKQQTFEFNTNEVDVARWTDA